MTDLPASNEHDDVVDGDDDDFIEDEQDNLEREVLDTFAELMRKVGLKFERNEQLGYVRVEIPNGREARPVLLSARAISDLGSTQLERYKFVGDFQAIWDQAADTIEAKLSGYAERRLWGAVPGIEVLDEKGIWRATSIEERLAIGSFSPPRGTEHRLRVEKGPVAIEVSSTSQASRVLCRPSSPSSQTLKITGAGPTTHDDALAVLNDLGQSFLFDLDLVYNMPIQLQRVGSRRAVRRPERSRVPPVFPANRYASEPVALYQYGREALGLPLLQFLAFYQVLEFFFSIFSREEGIKQLRNRLQDPRFNVGDDVAIGNLLTNLGTVRPSAEREQLRVVLKRCFDEQELRQFIEADRMRTEHFCANKQAIKGAGKISLSTGGVALTDQIADRIYAIRCRIVHTKQDGGQASVELLLPSSREVRSLRPDVDLVMHVAQRAIIAAASRRS